jgi:hypothetical protein
VRQHYLISIKMQAGVGTSPDTCWQIRKIRSAQDRDRATRRRDSRCAMNVTVRGITYRVTTEADIVRLLIALDTLQALARRKAA